MFLREIKSDAYVKGAGPDASDRNPWVADVRPIPSLEAQQLRLDGPMVRAEIKRDLNKVPFYLGDRYMGGPPGLHRQLICSMMAMSGA